MEVQFTADEEARLEQIARHHGQSVQELLKQSALGLLADDAHFRSAVEEGVRQADRGMLIDEDDMNRRLDRMLDR